MDPYEFVSAELLERIQRAVDTHIGGPRWDGIRDLQDLLGSFVEPDRVDRWQAATEAYHNEQTDHTRDGVFEASSHPTIERFIASRGANEIVDDLAILLSMSSRPQRICDLGCGSGNVTQIIGRLTGSDVLGIDIKEYWGQSSPDNVSPNVRFMLRNILDGAPGDLFDIVRAHAVYGHLDATDFWVSLEKWCRPAGLVFISDGWDASGEYASHLLAAHLDGMAFWPVACAPIGTARFWRSDYPGTMLICSRRAADGGLGDQCDQLVDDYFRMLEEGTAFFRSNNVPFQSQTFSHFSLRRRAP